ncbi:MAG: oligoendopeptidase F [Ignavibacteriaceae bacterium]
MFKPNILFAPHSGSQIISRENIDDMYKWDLTHIYSSDEEWEKDFQWIENNLNKYKDFIDTLAASPQNLLNCLKFDDETGIKLERLYLYSMLSKDSDMRVTKYQASDDRIKGLYAKVSTAASFIRPELLNIPENMLWEMVEKEPALEIYRHLFNDLLRTKAHTLSKEQEEILSLAGEITLAPYNTYSIFTNSDLKFSSVKDEEGNDTEISHARFYAAMYSKNRSFRQRVFHSYYKPYIEFANTITTLFNGNLKTNIFNAKARKYGSAREAALDRNNIPLSVYDNLIEAANNSLEPLHRWGELKKKILKIDELHPYDVYISIFSNKSEKKYSYEEGKEIVLNSLKHLGDDYLASIKTAFSNRWIDVYETPSKRSGAYSSGTTFGVHPYVLLNWTDLLNDVFTLSHEMGHNMHSYYTGNSQPYPYANYTIFLAEVASTFNESLLLDYLIENSSDKNEKLYLLEKYLNNITSTFYRQTMFAEFESLVYDKVENGEALTADVLRKLYKDMYQKYWGPAMVIDEEEEYTWARIPHFYYNFYVYQYATGYAASEVLAHKVKHEGKPAVEKYLNFLKSGSSDYSINILKAAGVDMNSPEPVIATTRKMISLLDEVESLL